MRLILNKHKPSVVALLEPFISVNKCKCWAKWLHFPNFCHNNEAGGKIWLFWVDGIDFELIFVMDQALSVGFLVELLKSLLLLCMLVVSNITVGFSRGILVS